MLIWNILGYAQHCERINVQLKLRLEEEKIEAHVMFAPPALMWVNWRGGNMGAFEHAEMKFVY